MMIVVVAKIEFLYFREFVLPEDCEICESDRGQRFLFLPWQYGSLQSKIGANKLSEAAVRPLFKQIVRAVAFCHSIGIIVRDLKLRKFVFIDEELLVFL